ncbi:D-3-phosphoglycerate dehydrogenase/hypothetical protein [Verrucomicrobium sp. GAS474]|uniref:phosphoglycerate dehydrogenase n=1 Tax=Verrucomicrobium sp. GAS474 TaxID=1882831 RepID=UPI00087DBAC4|nr:phosphoglycerate dehydrogenase [Verrucomicrobium sp. GAS474]SDT98644.1 D-3-phosphoglycerate dehydrogenase/hypothetical protein [Verrucomicrobium sp. GAS474]
MGRILVTPRSVTRSGHPSLDRLRAAGHEVVLGPAGRQPSEAELLELLPACEGYLAGVEPVSARVLAAASRLRAISRNGTGIDNVDTEAAQARGIALLRAEGANARGVAELTIGFLFALARGLPVTDARMKERKWERANGIELEGKTLGVVGCGRIGRLVSGMALGIGMKVIAQDLYPDASYRPSPDFRFAPLPELLAAADVVTLHCPPLPGHRPLIDAAALAGMKKGVFLVNTARFDLIDPAAIAAALDSGGIAALALDVFDGEPPQDWSLAAHPRVIASPHIGGFTAESIDRAMDFAVDNLLRALAATPAAH